VRFPLYISTMNIRDLLTPEQYEEQLQEYNKLVKNKQITFFEFLTETHKTHKNTQSHELR